MLVIAQKRSLTGRSVYKYTLFNEERIGFAHVDWRLRARRIFVSPSKNPNRHQYYIMVAPHALPILSERRRLGSSAGGRRGIAQTKVIFVGRPVRSLVEQSIE